MKIGLTCVVLVALFACISSGRLRRKRSFLSLGDMVSTLTDMNPASFVDYGQWCGFGGEGEPVDAIDRCCRSHDYCYDDAHAGVCKNWEGHLLLVNYRYDVKETAITCNGGQSPCSSAVCNCDVGLALCLRRHKKSFDPRNTGLRSKVSDSTEDTSTTTTADSSEEENEAIQNL